jgi:uncharacterized membrane protein
MERRAGSWLDGGMPDHTTTALTLVAAIGSGLVGGVFFAFSTFVMAGLRRLPAPQGIAAMQAMNEEAPTPPFMIPFIGTALLCIGLGIAALTRIGDADARWQLAGCVLYLVGIVLTAAYHVPRNDALALVDPTSPGAADTWRRYAATWTAWNHVRTLTSLLALVAFALAFRLG